MHVPHRLVAVTTMIHDDAEAILGAPRRFRAQAAHEHHPAEQGCVAGGRRRQTVDVPPWDDQLVERGRWCDVLEGENQVVLVGDRGRRRAADDGAERACDRGVIHCVLPRRTIDRQWYSASDERRTVVWTGVTSGRLRSHAVTRSPRRSRSPRLVVEKTFTISIIRSAIRVTYFLSVALTLLGRSRRSSAAVALGTTSVADWSAAAERPSGPRIATESAAARNIRASFVPLPIAAAPSERRRAMNLAFCRPVRTVWTVTGRRPRVFAAVP